MKTLPSTIQAIFLLCSITAGVALAVFGKNDAIQCIGWGFLMAVVTIVVCYDHATRRR